jgi:hypothetical protein
MDFTTKELLKRYAKLAIGQPFAPRRQAKSSHINMTTF